jgi:hypothetical protein
MTPISEHSHANHQGPTSCDHRLDGVGFPTRVKYPCRNRNGTKVRRKLHVPGAGLVNEWTHPPPLLHFLPFQSLREPCPPTCGHQGKHAHCHTKARICRGWIDTVESAVRRLGEAGVCCMRAVCWQTMEMLVLFLDICASRQSSQRLQRRHFTAVVAACSGRQTISR